MYKEGNGSGFENMDLLMQVVEYADATPPTISRSPASLTPSAEQGDIPPPDTFTVRNSGGGALAYTITDNVNWLSVDPDDGISSGEADPIEVTYSTGLLSVGQYAATITIDLAAQTVTGPDFSASFDIDPFVKHSLLNGLDDIALTLQAEAAINSFEDARPDHKPALR